MPAAPVPPPGKAEFLRIASHELRTPLTSLRGYSELLVSGRAGPLSEQQLRMVAMIDLCASRVYGIVEDLIVLAGLDEGSFGLAVEPTRLAPLAVRVAGELATRARAAGVTIDVAVPDAAALDADPRHLQRALANLLSAAIAFAPRQGTVRLAAEPDPGGSVRVALRCPLGGTPAGEQRALYERCFGPGPAELEGIGLALVVVAAVVRHHGGSLAVSASDTDVTVTVILPPAPPPDPSHVVLHRRAPVRT
ncbi:histidine kinase dimerization/phospho-acceptor domain-containing protein [Dactylosporangium sp. NPDC051485]|uniref:sensor histidine kinase n=1 Tax=Dactylosporangium sp. NPDC051485 TaxID=3154846 RepID=UPI00343F0D18